ncbi:unnamed protein product, partial [Durusdinium trenchii]
VAFTEKVWHAQKTLARDFPTSCVYTDAIHVLPAHLREVFDPSILSRPHVAVGNGQHMACAGVAIAVALACIQLHDMGPVP